MFKARLNLYLLVPVFLALVLFGIGQTTVKADTVIQSVAVGSTPMDVAVSPSGDRVYVTNQGSNTVSVIDTTTTPNTVIANVAAPAGSILTNLAVSPDNTKVFVVSQNTGILILSTSGLTFNPTPITVGTTPIDVAFDSNGIAYVTNYTSWTVSIINTSNTVTATINVHEGPRGITVTTVSGSQRVYFACAGASNSEVGYFAAGALGGSPTHFNVAGGAFFLAARPDGTKLYVSLNVSNQTASINTSTNAVTTLTNSGGAPFGVAVAATPTGNRAFVADSNGTGITWDLTRINSTTPDAVLTPLTVTKKPKGVAANAAGTRVYVACLGTGSAGKVDVIDTTF